MGYLDDAIVTQEEINVNHVQAAPDRLTGTPRQNKMVFDKMGELVAGKHNSLVEAVLQLSNRVDNIIAGTAPSAEEIIDAREGTDGTIYNTLGAAIRTQIQALQKPDTTYYDARVIKIQEYLSDNLVAVRFERDDDKYAEYAPDFIELYINGLKANSETDGYTVTVTLNAVAPEGKSALIVTFSFANAPQYGENDFAEVIIRRTVPDSQMYEDGTNEEY